MTGCGQDDFDLVDVVLFGFPPVPFAKGPHSGRGSNT
jgi:hypothetical protein